MSNNAETARQSTALGDVQACLVHPCRYAASFKLDGSRAGKEAESEQGTAAACARRTALSEVAQSQGQSVS